MKMREKRKKLLVGIAVCGIVFGVIRETTLRVNAEEYFYDDLNRITMVIYDDGGTVEYIYDSNGNIVEAIVSPIISEELQDTEDEVSISDSGGENTLNGFAELQEDMDVSTSEGISNRNEEIINEESEVIISQQSIVGDIVETDNEASKNELLKILESIISFFESIVRHVIDFLKNIL